MLPLKQQKTASVFYCISILKWPWNLGAKTDIIANVIHLSTRAKI